MKHVQCVARVILFSKAAALVLTSLVLAGCGDSNARPNQISETLSATEAVRMIAERRGNVGFAVLDVRTPEEYAPGHVTGAVNVDFSGESFRSEVDKLDKDVAYVVYCASGGRSRVASEIMGDLGFAEVYRVSSGYTALVNAGAIVSQGA